MRAAAPLLVAALLLFTANLAGTTLPPLDDCFYARKGAEMAAAPGMTVRWAGNPAFQNPPGHLWILAASFRLFGVNDAAARLPTGLMAVGSLAGLAWIGARLLSPAAGVAGAALFAVSPFFLNHGRRVMLEVPLLFWTVAAMMALVAWRRRPNAVLAFAPALGMAILTKSVLGLMPLGVALAAGILLPAWCPLLRDVRFWVAASLGLALGASWPVHQWLAYGHEFLDVHFVREIAGRSLAETRPSDRLLGYPAILFTQHAPAFLAALPATWSWLRSWRERSAGPAALLMAWGWLPLFLYALSSAQSARYVFPLMPAFALLGGAWLEQRWPRATRVAATRVVPLLLAVAAAIFWVRPEWLTRDGNRPYRDAAATLAARAPRGTEVAFLGGDYWRFANPLLWYAGLRLGPQAPTGEEASVRALTGSRLLLVERGRLAEVPAAVASAPRIVETRDAVLLDLRAAP